MTVEAKVANKNNWTLEKNDFAVTSLCIKAFGVTMTKKLSKQISGNKINQFWSIQSILYSLITNHKGLINDINNIKTINIINTNCPCDRSWFFPSWQFLSSFFSLNNSDIKVAEDMTDDNINKLPIWMFSDKSSETIKKLLVNMAETGKPTAAMVKKEYEID